MATVNATAGVDTFTGVGGANNTTAGNDTIIYTQGNQVDNAPPTVDSIDGGTGIDTIQIGNGGNGITIDLGKATLVAPFVPATFLNIEALAFTNTAGTSVAKLLAEQFGAGVISNSLAVSGILGSNQAINITILDALGTGGTFDASAWTFTNWTSGTDVIDIKGSAGNDIITGSTAADLIDAGTGDDIINLANGFFAAGESINGGTNVVGPEADNLILTNATTVDFTAGVLTNIELLTGSAGNDVLTMSFGQWNGIATAIDLGAGVNTLNVVASVVGAGNGNPGTGPASISNVTTGNLVGTGGNDTMTASGAQLDAIIIGAGTIDLGGGTDTINLTSTSNDLNILGAADALITGVENISVAGAAPGATLTLSGQTEGFTITGGAGAHIITSGSGADIISTGGGADTIVSGLGADIITGGAAADSISAGGGDDTINLASGDFVSGESIDGGTGADAIVLINNVTVDLSVGTITGVETLTGSAASDTVTMSATQWSNFTTIDLVGATNTLNVVASGDIATSPSPALANISTGNLRGTAGNDTVTLSGARLDAIIIGGGNIDLGAGAADTINLTSTSADLNTLGANNNSIAGVEVISAATAAAGVTITLAAQAEAFTITGGAGDDSIAGGTGADNISGGSGSDTITGGAGADTLSGGGNADVFNFAAGNSALTIAGNLTSGSVTGYDAITDFTAGSVAGISDVLGFAGAVVATNTAATNGTNSVLQLHAAAIVASHSISNGIITFDDADTFAAAVPLANSGDLAAVVDYLQRNSLGAVGTSVAFTATIAGVAHSYVYIEGGASGTDELVDLQNVTAASITASAGQISVHVTPVVQNDILAAVEDSPIIYTAGDLLGNDTNAIAIAIASVTSGTGGTAVLNADGTVTFTPNANFNGLASFSYIATEGVVNSAIATVTVNVAAVNDPPVVTALTGTAGEDGPAFSQNLLTGASDVDVGDTLSIAGLSGTVTTTGGRVLTSGTHYTLTGSTLALTAAGFALFNSLPQGVNDTATFSFGVTDGTATTPNTLVLTITGANDLAAIAGISTGAVAEDGTLTAGNTLSVSDADTGQSHFQTPASLAGTFGTFAFNATTGVWGYTLANGQANVQALAAGQVVHDTLSVASLDGTATCLIDVTVTGTNDAPVGAPTATLLGGTEDVTYTVSAAQLLAGFSDVDGDVLSVANLVSSNGTIANSGNGTFTITPTANFNGAVTLTYNVTDGHGGAVTGQTRLYTLAPVNDTPTGIALSNASVLEFRANGTVVGNLSATDPDTGNTFTYQLLNNAGGRFAIAGNQLTVANGLLLDFEQAASHSVTVRVTDNGGLTFDKTFVIAVGDVNPENIVGNAANNTFVGGAGNDILNGGAGIDTLRGQGGNDTYIVDSAADVVIEVAGGGIADRIKASVSYVLAAAVNVEFLETTNVLGLGAINLTGNALANTITGNAGANILDGGAGADALIGGLGNDIYRVDNILDNITETIGQGTADRTQARVSFGLAAGDNIEFLETINAAAVTAINLTGNEFAQTVIGNSGSNVINGGLGNDTLTGGAGADFFVFNTALNAAANRDTITDFNAAADTIRLENNGAGLFNLLAAGTLNAAFFKANATGTATDTDDHIIYNTTTGALFYDTNGNAAGGVTQFATLTAHPAITNLDFFVI
jgi:VCBS repeat-containing protein